MRCPKCGFISFDYLENCLKCNTDLTEERDRLNLSGIKPEPFSLLELAERVRLALETDKSREKEKTEAKKIPTKTQQRPLLNLSEELGPSLKMEAFALETEVIAPEDKGFPNLFREGTCGPDQGKADESSKLFSPEFEAVVFKPISKAAGLKKTGPEKPNPFLATLVEPQSVVAEQFRKLKTRIYRLKASGSLKTIMITSAMDGEGKSFTAANLGVSLSREIHNRVLLIDCDLRKSGLTKYFGLENERGLSEYIRGKGGIQDLVKETGIERLRILPAGMAENAPADLIASNKMKTLLDDLKSQTETEFIIIDSTPILATTEPEVLGGLVDGIIFVVRAGVTPRETVEQALESLEPEKILGGVLNDLVIKTPGLRSSYFGTDGYSSSYGDSNGNRPTNIQKYKRKLLRFGRVKKGSGEEDKSRP